MVTMEVLKVEAATVVGVLVRAPHGYFREAKQNLADEIRKRYNPKGKPYMMVTMPCEKMWAISTEKRWLELPVKDIPCSCGDPTHWFIKFEVA